MSKDPEAWLKRFFDPLFFDAATSLTVNPAEREITAGAHELVPVVSLVDASAGASARVPPKGLILAPFHVPRLLNDEAHGPAAFARVAELADAIRAALGRAYGEGAPLEHIVWAGMGGSIEDKYLALASGMMPEDTLRVWGLDDVNADTLAHIFAGIAACAPPLPPGASEAEEPPLKRALRRTVVVAQALGMTSVEPVFNVQHALVPAFTAFGLDVSSHFYKVTIPGSLLDKALVPPVANLPHQPAEQSTCAGRHDYVAHGMLLPLHLAGGSAREYAASLDLAPADVGAALQTAEWIAAAAERAGHGGATLVLLLPPAWRGRWHARAGVEGGAGLEWRDASLWFKQHIEESLGKTPSILLKVVTSLEAPSAPQQQLVLSVAVEGLEGGPQPQGEGWDVRELRLRGPPTRALGQLMQQFTVLKYALAEAWGLCAVNQPPVETYKRIVAHLMASEGGGPLATVAPLLGPATRCTVGGVGAPVSICYLPSASAGALPADAVAAELSALGLDASAVGDVLGALHRIALRAAKPRACYGEAIYFGNLSRGADARAMRDVLDGAFARDVWARACGSFADVGKGPAVGHATHAMGKQGSALTLSLLPAAQDSSLPHPALLDAYPAGYQEANAYANVLALAGYDVKEGEGVVPGVGHPGAVVLVRIARNDEPTRAELARVFARVAEVVRMEPAPTA